MEELPQFAFHWATELGSKPTNLERLHGGINNQVYLCSAKRDKWVIKGFPPAEEGQRDRMKAEVQFLRFSNEVAPSLAPKLIHADEVHRCILLEYLEGKSFAEGKTPQEDEILTAVRFVELLNRDIRKAQDWIDMDASEGFLSLRNHLVNVKQRLEAMSCDHVTNHYKPMAIAMLERIRAEFDQVQDNTNRLIDLDGVPNCIEPDERCISPGDFGFHNAIITPNGVKFIDFEFAGWDDPAKTTLDFILQPRVPIWGKGSPLSIAWPPEARFSISTRCQILGPIIRLKWACIILSVLNPVRLERLKLVNIASGEWAGLIQKRLESAGTYLVRTREMQLYSA
jgi:hypothetical protein